MKMKKTRIAVTMGDPAGIGPEITLMGLQDPSIASEVEAVVVGDTKRLEAAAAALKATGRLTEGQVNLRTISDISEAKYEQGTIDVLDLANVPSDLPWGQVSVEAGNAAFEYVKKSVELAVAKQVDAICTAPINKEAWKLANVPYPGHTEALAALSGSDKSAMMLVNHGLRVVHVTTHVSLKDAIAMATTERVFERIKLTVDSLEQFGVKNPRIAVAGLNPHAGEGGLFGQEDIEQIRPAIELAKQSGMDVSGPWPPDSIYSRAATGEFDAVIAMYHDQGHIAIKMLGFDTGINVTLGLPILRTSVDHGTAFDIAGKGIAREQSMVQSLQVAIDFLQGKASGDAQ
ncbi:4-hydroxythreonine-4-phosphate dehydrogenase PdxA [Alicyclobacillus fastidiosus]|uniref:4-hydroxythreonine-4-phosphate dehydrogenase PdxA n=2 Tax=Alicyclobacillus fastidiosus TaxID=392011 RepID=A0ABY6ZQU4_9BACL|nr:4-hydroxythreonine-4-phosphate dehydrogenase PdxA [Alicyclobacillus fastidiosus]WAH44526.1 4-hydroxythreonine-4-phosphate dehydrogenase PdxA [Alicyclobacillus fastidiosus]